MRLRFLGTFLLFPLFLCMFGCGEISHGNIPETTVNFTVRPLDMDNTLHVVGSYKYFPYGYSGVFVYHLGDMDEEYVAFEQACPLDWEDGCYVEFNPDRNRLVGKLCKGEFSTYTGYGATKTVSRYALRKYHITYTGSNGAFQVSN